MTIIGELFHIPGFPTYLSFIDSWNIPMYMEKKVSMVHFNAPANDPSCSCF